MNLRFVDLSGPIQAPVEGELRGGMGAILAAEIEYQSHTDTHREFAAMFAGAGPEHMPDGQAIGAERLRLTAHAGTHVDAPWHYFPTSEGRPARTIDQLELEHFFAPGVVLDLRGHEPGDRIEPDEVAAAVEATGAPGLDRGNPYMARDFRATGDAALLWEAHRVGIDHEYFQVEKLCNLGALPPRGFHLSCFPVKIAGASGGWCRAVAILGLAG